MLEEAQAILDRGAGIDRVLFVLFGEQAYRTFESVLDSLKIRRMSERLPKP